MSSPLTPHPALPDSPPLARSTENPILDRRSVLRMGLVGTGAALMGRGFGPPLHADMNPRPRGGHRPARAESACHVFSLTGEWSQTGACISSMIRGGVPVDLAVSDSPNMADYRLVGPKPPAGDDLYRHDLSGMLSPGRQYFAQPVVNGELFGRTLTFRTAADDATPETLRIGLVSCQNNPEAADPAQPGWRRLLTYAPHLVLHMGDFGYWGAHLINEPYTAHVEKYAQALAGLPVMRQALESASSLIQVSDHETSHNDGDNYHDACTETALNAYFRLMPWTSFDDDRRRSRFLTRRLGPNIRLIAPDFRSLDRSRGYAPDDDRKTAYGAYQFSLLEAALRQPEALKIILSDPGCAPADPPIGRNPHLKDKWCNYQNAYQKMVDVIRNERTVDGKPIMVDMWSGDRHMIGYTLEKDNTWGPFDVIVSSSIDQIPLALDRGEIYTAVYGNRVPGRHDDRRNQVHVELDLTDDKSGTITRTARGIDDAAGSEVWRTIRTWSY